MLAFEIAAARDRPFGLQDQMVVVFPEKACRCAVFAAFQNLRRFQLGSFRSDCLRNQGKIEIHLAVSHIQNCFRHPGYPLEFPRFQIYHSGWSVRPTPVKISTAKSVIQAVGRMGICGLRCKREQLNVHICDSFRVLFQMGGRVPAPVHLDDEPYEKDKTIIRSGPGCPGPL